MESSETRQSEIQHQRDTRLQLVLPMALVVLLLAICLTVVLLFPRRLQVSIVADIMLTMFMLCPAVICLFPLTLGMIIAIFGMSKAHDGLARPVRRVTDYSKILTDRTTAATDTINETTIGLSARLGGVYKLLGMFESEDDKPDGSDTEVE